MAPSTTETAVGRIKPCRLIELEQHNDDRGHLSVVESELTTGFPIRRIYYLHNVRSGIARGGHAHQALEQLLIAAHGSFTVHLDDGERRAEYRLDDPGTGLYVGPMVWRDLTEFSPDAVCLVLASDHYDEADYYRTYEEYMRNNRGLA